MNVLKAIFAAGGEPNWFQIVAIGLLVGLVLRDVLGFSRVPGGTTVRMLRCLVWLVAALAIRNPLIVQDVAEVLGIGHGSNLILYMTVLAFLWVSFYQYSCYLRLQREVTQLVRHVAITEATREEQKPA